MNPLLSLDELPVVPKKNDVNYAIIKNYYLLASIITIIAGFFGTAAEHHRAPRLELALHEDHACDLRNIEGPDPYFHQGLSFRLPPHHRGWFTFIADITAGNPQHQSEQYANGDSL